MFEIIDLIWDEGNVAHIARHQVTQEEVEQALSGFCAVRDSYGGRLMVLGQTNAARLLAVIVHPKGEERYYVVTARSADRKERAIYQTERERGGEEAA